MRRQSRQDRPRSGVRGRQSLPRRILGIGLAAVLALVTVTTAGCWDRTEIDEQLHILSGFLDLEPDGSLRLTTEVLALGIGGGEGGKGGGGTHAVFSTRGRSMQEALWNMTWVAEAVPNVSHMALLVVGEDLAREGLRDILDSMVQNYQVRRSLLLAVAPGKASDLLATGLTASRHSEQYIGMLRNAQGGAGEVTMLQLNDFLRALSTDGVDPLAAQLTILPAPPVEHVEEHTQGSVPRMEGGGGGSEGGGPGGAPPGLASLRGAAIFSGDRLAGFAESHEAMGLTWLRTPVRNHLLWVPTGPGRQGFTVRVSASAPSHKVHEVDGRLHIECRVVVECDVNELAMPAEMFTPQDIAQLVTLLAAHIEGQIRSGVAYASEVLGADPVGFGRHLSRHDPQLWSRLRDRWPELLRDADYRVEVEAEIITTGMLLRKQLPPATRAPGTGP